MKFTQICFTLFLLPFLGVGNLSAQVEIDGIWYKLDATTRTAVVVNDKSPDEYDNLYPGNVVIPSSVTVSDDGVYTVTGISTLAFRSSDVRSVTIPNTVTCIEGSSFEYCYNLRSVSIPSSVTEIGSNAFYECLNLQAIEIPEGVKAIGNYTFYNCVSLQTVHLANSVTSIGERAFNYCTELTSVQLPASLVTLGTEAFWECFALTSVEIPASVKKLERGAFKDCTALASVTLLSTTPPEAEAPFGGCSVLKTIYVPLGCKEAYNVEPWNKYEIKEGAMSIGKLENGALQPAAQRVYRMDGTLVEGVESVDDLPKGLYIIGGKKVLK